MLPVVDKPAIQYVVEEAVAVGPGRRPDDHRPQQARRSRTTSTATPSSSRRSRPRATASGWPRSARRTELATVHYVRQGDPLGLGHAVLCAAQHVGDEPFAVLLGDDLIDPRDPLLATMIAVRERYGGSRHRPDGGAARADPPLRLRRRRADRRRPTTWSRSPTWSRSRAAREAPSNLAIIGRYVLDASVFEVLRETQPGRGGEIQLTDALRTLAAARPGEGGGVHGVVFRGRRYDTGDRLDYLKAVVRLAAGARRPRPASSSTG